MLQPSYIPWRGYFHQLQKADVFIFYDDVQYDKHGWRNRNRIKTAHGPIWLTIPVHASGAPVEGTHIRDIRISWDRDWRKKHSASLTQAYRRTRFFQKYAPLLVAFFERHDEYLADFTIDLTVALAAELGIQGTRFIRSSTLGVSGNKMDHLAGLLAAVRATHYISGPSAKGYLDEARLAAAGVTVEYMSYEYPEYAQAHPPYDPFVSIVDLLFAEGPAAPAFVWPGEAPQGRR